MTDTNDTIMGVDPDPSDKVTLHDVQHDNRQVCYQCQQRRWFDCDLGNRLLGAKEGDVPPCSNCKFFGPPNVECALSKLLWNDVLYKHAEANKSKTITAPKERVVGEPEMLAGNVPRGWRGTPQPGQPKAFSADLMENALDLLDKPAPRVKKPWQPNLRGQSTGQSTGQPTGHIQGPPPAYQFGVPQPGPFFNFQVPPPAYQFGVPQPGPFFNPMAMTGSSYAPQPMTFPPASTNLAQTVMIQDHFGNVLRVTGGTIQQVGHVSGQMPMPDTSSSTYQPRQEGRAAHHSTRAPSASTGRAAGNRTRAQPPPRAAPPAPTKRARHDYGQPQEPQLQVPGADSELDSTSNNASLMAQMRMEMDRVTQAAERVTEGQLREARSTIDDLRRQLEDVKAKNARGHKRQRSPSPVRRSLRSKFA